MRLGMQVQRLLNECYLLIAMNAAGGIEQRGIDRVQHSIRQQSTPCRQGDCLM